MKRLLALVALVAWPALAQNTVIPFPVVCGTADNKCVPITTMSTTEMDDTMVLKPDGSGGVTVGPDMGGSGGAPDDYLKSVNAAGALVAVVGGTEEPPVSLRNLLALDNKLNKAIPELPRSGTLTVEKGERFMHPDFGNNVYIWVHAADGALNTGNFAANSSRYVRVNNPSNGEIVAGINNSLGQSDWQSGGSQGTTVTANPTGTPTATLMNVGIGTNVFRVGRATYYDSGASPVVAGIATPRVHGEIAVNNLGHVYPAVTKREQHGSTPPSITAGNFSPTDFYEFTSSTVGNRGDFYHFVDDYFIQNQTVPGGADNFPHVTFHDAWDYIVTNVTGGNTAEYRGYRDDWIWLGEYDNVQDVADALSHHADKADNTKTFAFALELSHRVQRVVTFTDRMGIFEDVLSWGDDLIDSEDAIQLISQYQSVRAVGAGYQPTEQDWQSDSLLKIGNQIYRVIRSAPHDMAASVSDWTVVPALTTIRYNGGTLDHRFRGVHHHDSDVSNPQDADVYVVWNRHDLRTYDVRTWRDRHVTSLQVGGNDGAWQGHYETEAEAVDALTAAGQYVGVGYQLRRANDYTAATTTYTYHLENIAGDVPRLTDAEATALDYLAFISPDDSELTVGVHGTGTARVFGYLPDDNVGALDPDFSEVDSAIEKVYYLQSDYSVETDLAGKICFERTEDENAEDRYGGLVMRTVPDAGNLDPIVYELERDDYTDDDTRRYCTTTTIASGYHWDDGETHHINLQNPAYVRTTLGTPWLWHRSLTGEASDAAVTLDAVKAFARATGQTGSRAIRGSDMDDDTIQEGQLSFQNAVLDTDAGGYLPVKVRNAETSGFVRAQIKAKDVQDNTLTEPKLAVHNTPSATNNSLGWDNDNSRMVWQPEGSATATIADESITEAKLKTTATYAATGMAPIVAIADGDFHRAANGLNASGIGTNAVTTPKINNRAVTGAKIALDTITEGNLNVNNTPDATNNSLGWDNANSRLVWQPEGSGGTSTPTNLSTTQTAGEANVTINSSTGTGAPIAPASTTVPGIMSAADKAKLDGLEQQITMVPMSNVTYDTADTADLSGRFGSGATIVSVNLDVTGNDDAEIDDLFVFQFRENLASIDDDRAIGIRINSSTALPIRIVDPITQGFVNKTVGDTTRYTFHFLTRQDGVFIELSPTLAFSTMIGRLLPAASTGSTGQIMKIQSDGTWGLDSDQTGGGSGSTDLSITRTANAVTVVSSSGDNADIFSASTTNAGVLTSADKTKLDGLAIARQLPAASGGSDGQVAKIDGNSWVIGDDSTGSGSTNLSIGTRTTTTMVVESSSGTNATLPEASGSEAGLLGGADKTKLDNLVGAGSNWRYVGAPNAPFGWNVNSLQIDLGDEYDVVGQILVLQWADNVGVGEDTAAMRLRLGNQNDDVWRAIEGRPGGAHNFRDFIGSDIIEDAIYVLQRTSTKWRILFAASTDGSVDLTGYLTQAQIDARVQNTVEFEQTIWLPASAWEAQSTAPPEQATQNGSSDGPDVHYWAFDQTTVEKVQTTVTFPDNWNEGTIQYRVTWEKDNAQTGTVVWGMRGLSVGDGDDSSGNVYGTHINVQDANQDSLSFAITAWSNALTIRNADRDAVTYIELERDADNGNDSLAQDARLIGVEIRFTATGIDGA